jgi:isopentenyl diphosphate isomerase/L-lactate dehydrogenase-like FMN-dependent dehydrogenase
LQTTILGQAVTMPVMTAPCSLNTLAHREGEQGVARAAAAAGIIQVLSTGSGFSLEEVARSVAGPRWFQLYCFRDPAVTRELRRAMTRPPAANTPSATRVSAGACWNGFGASRACR